MRVVRSAAWVGLLAVASLAVAGLVVTLDHPPSGEDRPELVALDAAVLAPRLTAIEPALMAMATAAGDLAEAGRTALVALRAGDVAAVATALDAGDRALDALATSAGDVRDAEPRLLVGLDDGSRLPADALGRVRAMGAAIGGVDAMRRAWQEVGSSVLAPTAFLDALDRHTAAVETATAAGRAGRYADALAALAPAVDALREAGLVRDQVAAGGHPVPALDDLLGRLHDLDTALDTLYRDLVRTDGVRTPAVEAALAGLDAAATALQGDDVDLADAVDEAGASEITAALLVIDDGRGTIEAAIGEH